MAKNDNLIVVKVMAIGLIIAALSYLFHPEIGQFNFSIRGLPLTEAASKFAALPTFFVILALGCRYDFAYFSADWLFYTAGKLFVGIHCLGGFSALPLACIGNHISGRGDYVVT